MQDTVTANMNDPNDNNWAEYYINNHKAKMVIFACSPGWYDYSERLAFHPKYNDIDEVLYNKVTGIDLDYLD